MTVPGGGDGAGPVLRGEIGREGFASGMQGTGIRDQGRAGREGFAGECPHPCAIGPRMNGAPGV